MNKPLITGLALGAGLLLSACSDGGRDAAAAVNSRAAADTQATRAAGAPRVSVAVLDSGINVYHAYFHAGSPIYPDSAPSSVTPEVLEAFGIGERNTIRLTRTGNFLIDFEADREIWENIRPFQFYWFEGTNIIASTDQVGDIAAGIYPILPDNDDDTHGVGTSAAVLTANPDAILVFIEPNSYGSIESHRLAFTHPEIDMVSTSYGASLALGLLPIPETENFEFSYEGVVGQGKLHFSSSGNGPGLSPLRAGAGPWWSLGISGSEEDTSNGRTALSGVFPDFVADYTQDLPYCAVCQDGLRQVGGTSFSTPRAAGVASRVLLEARRAADHRGAVQTIDGTPFMVAANGVFITNWQLRRALEEAAWIPPTGDYDPVEGVLDIGGLPFVPGAEWLQLGWGELTANVEKGVVAEALAQLGFGEPTRSKPQAFCDFQTAWIRTRKQYWDEFAPGSESAGVATADNDPFEYCAASF